MSRLKRRQKKGKARQLPKTRPRATRTWQRRGVAKSFRQKAPCAVRRIGSNEFAARKSKSTARWGSWPARRSVSVGFLQVGGAPKIQSSKVPTHTKHTYSNGPSHVPHFRQTPNRISLNCPRPRPKSVGYFQWQKSSLARPPGETCRLLDCMPR